LCCDAATKNTTACVTRPDGVKPCDGYDQISLYYRSSCVGFCGIVVVTRRVAALASICRSLVGISRRSRFVSYRNTSEQFRLSPYFMFSIDIAVNRNLFVRNRLSRHERAEHEKKMFLFFCQLGDGVVSPGLTSASFATLL
jgi:hypothetical protein